MNTRLTIPAKCRQDSRTNQFVVYNNELNLSGYGATRKKAREVFVRAAHEALTPMKKVSSKKQSPLRG